MFEFQNLDVYKKAKAFHRDFKSLILINKRTNPKRWDRKRTSYYAFIKKFQQEIALLKLVGKSNRWCHRFAFIFKNYRYSIRSIAF